MENVYQLRRKIYNKLLHREIAYPDLRFENTDSSTDIDIDLSKKAIFYKGYKLICSYREKYISVGVYEESNNLKDISFDYSKLNRLLKLL